MTVNEAKKKIFEVIISCEISIYTAGPYAPVKAVIPISNILHLIDGLSRYKARLALKELIKDGLLEYTSQGCPAIVSSSNESHCEELLDEAHPPINGYALTKKGFKSEKFKKQHNEWEKSMEEWARGFEE